MTAAFSVFRPPSTPGPIVRDFEAYYAAGAAVNAGADPYSRAVWDTQAHILGVDAGRDELLPFVGPAAGLPLWALLARLPYRTAAGVWIAMLIGAYVTLLRAGWRLAGAARGRRAVVATAVFGLTAAPLLGCFALGQVALISAAALAAAFAAYRARSAAGAFAATLLTAAQPNLALALVGRIRSGWDAVAATAAAGAFAALSLLAGGGPAGVAAYLQRLSAHAGAERFVTIQHTPAAIAYAFGIAPRSASAAGLAVAAVACLGTVLVIVRERLDATTAAFICCASLPLAVPFFHEHDFVVEIVPLTVLALRANGRARTLGAIAVALILVDWFGFAQRHGAAGQIVSLGTACVLAYVACGPARLRVRGEIAGLITLAAAAALAVPLGRSNAAPTWPDALPAAYHAGPAADASTVWAGEQHAAGLDARNPVWGLLRGMPLAGCVVLGAALVADARNRRRRPAHRAGTLAARPQSPVTV